MVADVGQEDWLWRYHPEIPVGNTHSSRLVRWFERLIGRHTTGSRVLSYTVSGLWQVVGWVPGRQMGRGTRGL